MASIGSHSEYQEHRNPAKVDENNVCRLLQALEVGNVNCPVQGNSSLLSREEGVS